MINRLYLINPPCEWINSVAYSDTLPYQGILSIASYVGSHFPDLEICVLDGNILTYEQIVENVKPNAGLIGISSFTYNHGNAIRLAGYLKKKYPESIIVLGGGIPTSLPETVMKNHPDIDYLILKEGELAFLDLIKGVQPEKKHGV